MQRNGGTDTLFWAKQMIRQGGSVNPLPCNVSVPPPLYSVRPPSLRSVRPPPLCSVRPRTM